MLEVYVIDDDEAIRGSLTFLLRAAGYLVRSYDDASEFLREADKPLCRITLSAEKGEGDVNKVVIKPGCSKVIAAFGLATWRLDRDQLVLAGKGGAWRFAEAEPTTWERVPLSADPLLLVRQ